MLKGVEAELKRATNSLKEKDGELRKLQKDLQQERDEKMDIINEGERWRKEKQETEEKLSLENNHLKERLDAANEQIKLNQTNAEGIVYRVQCTFLSRTGYICVNLVYLISILILC